MKSIKCNIIKAGRGDVYGRPFAIGQIYTGPFDYVRQLVSCGYATVDDAAVFDDDSTPQNSEIAIVGKGRMAVEAELNEVTGGIVFSIGGVAYSFDTPAYTWVGRPVASTENVGLVIRITDVGLGAGSLWQSDGVTWHPVNGRVVLSRGQSLAASPIVALVGATGKLVIPSGVGIVGGSYVVPSGLLQAGSAIEVTAKVKKLGTGGTWSIAARLGTGNTATDAAIASGSGAATNDNDLLLSQTAEIISNTSLISSTFAVPNQPTTGAMVDKNTTLNMSATQYVGLWIGALNAADTVKLLSYEIALVG